MTKHEQQHYRNEPDHPIIEGPWQYQIIDMTLHMDLDDSLKSYIDLTLEKGSITRRLRFWGPQELEIEKGFPSPTHGMRIIDISERQWQDLSVAVIDFEASQGAITFYAKSVTDLEAS